MTTPAPGERWEMANGWVTGVLRVNNHPELAFTDGWQTWRADGSWTLGHPSEYDLVRRVIVTPADDPAPPAAPDQTRQVMAAILGAGMLSRPDLCSYETTQMWAEDAASHADALLDALAQKGRP